jgi:cyclophilin family peptidyl-prolyl cis-trans isomerase
MTVRLGLACLVLALAAAAPGSPGDYASLRRDFTNLYQSLSNAGGIAPGDRAAIEKLRQRAEAFDREHPDDAAGLAIELQLNLWLQDADAVDRLYGRLASLTRDPEIGLAWVRHFQAAGDRRRVGEIYERLARLFPGDAAVVLGWARFYREANLCARALEVLESASLDPAAQPDAAIMRSDCLFAEERFDDAVAALEAIPQEKLSADPGLRARVEPLLAARREYPALWEQEQQRRSAEARAADLPRIEIVTAKGRIVAELFENEAPNTVANFIALAEAGFYEGTRFHRLIPNSMIEGGDPNTRAGATEAPGSGGPGYRIADEFDREGARRHFAGSLGMANTGSAHSAGSRFYITFEPAPDLNAGHTVFGRVVNGMEVVRGLEADDAVESVSVLRKRDHVYEPERLTESPAASVTVTPPAPAGTSAPAGPGPSLAPTAPDPTPGG